MMNIRFHGASFNFIYTAYYLDVRGHIIERARSRSVRGSSERQWRSTWDGLGNQFS